MAKHRAELIKTTGRHRPDDPGRTAITKTTVRAIAVFAIVALTAPFAASPAAADPPSSYGDDGGYGSTWGEPQDDGFGRAGTRIG